MRKVSLLAIGFVVLMTCAASLHGQDVSNNQQWLEERYQEALSIKEGMTRADLLQVYLVDGGINRIPASRYVLRSCRLIKVEVEFDTKYGQAYRERPDTQLIIKKVSEPYLERMFHD